MGHLFGKQNFQIKNYGAIFIRIERKSNRRNPSDQTIGKGFEESAKSKQPAGRVADASNDVDGDAMFPDAVVPVAKDVPAGGLRLPASFSICGAGHNRVFACLTGIP